MFTISHVRGALARLGVFAVAFLLASCGGGGGSSSDPPASSGGSTSSQCSQDCGTAIIAITDADGDFLTYTVDVVSLKLKRANGAMVETLPATTRIDFAQYVDLTEFFTAATIPNGDYVGATLRLDFGNADIAVEQNGAPVAAKAVDASGNELGVVDVNVTLDSRHHFVVLPGKPSLFTLDFNLAATNSVDLTTAPATVTVTPALVASLDLVDQKDLRVRGPLVSVDKSAETYVVDLRPFNMRHQKYGQVTVHTNENTTFEVNGTDYTGSAGLDALSAAGAGTLTAAFGTLTTATREFDAKTVRAGTSVAGAGIDTVIGDVVARSGDVLTVRGATIVRNSDGARYARGAVQVTIGANTKVVQGGTVPAQLATPGAISVGQSIEAFGAAAPVVSSAMSGDWTLDATAGRVRMHVTPLYGFVKQAANGSLTLQLDSIAGRKVSAFDFTGTGLTPAQDADPANYEVTSGALDLSGLNVGEPTKLFGFPTAFGAAPPDFTARTFVDFPRLPALLSLSWGANGTTAPFSTQETTSLVLDLANTAIGRLHFLTIGPRVLDLKTLPASPSIVPPVEGPTAYLIVMPGMSHAFHDFSDFVTELGTRLNGSTAMVGFTSSGAYNGDTNVLAARSIVVVLK
ncbi:MAG TPA: hypothetical protein VK624_07760 [Steroidobacteraceae bacterium]|nr:hypothetical protein [Steroidobacteraceae bacterium]